MNRKVYDLKLKIKDAIFQHVGFYHLVSINAKDRLPHIAASVNKDLTRPDAWTIMVNNLRTRKITSLNVSYQEVHHHYQFVEFVEQVAKRLALEASYHGIFDEDDGYTYLTTNWRSTLISQPVIVGSKDVMQQFIVEEETIMPTKNCSRGFQALIMDTFGKGENKNMKELKYKKVIFNNPATIILWEDGTKTVVKCQNGETFDPEKGMAMCFMKKMLGNKYDYYHKVAKELKQYEKEQRIKEDIIEVINNIGKNLNDAFSEIVRMEQEEKNENS